jgi:hypothetical protein
MNIVRKALIAGVSALAAIPFVPMAIGELVHQALAYARSLTSSNLNPHGDLGY